MRGREQVALQPADAARKIVHHEIVRVSNDRGSCLSTARIDDRLLPQVIELSTGAWFAPVECFEGDLPAVTAFEPPEIIWE